jgi:hypothetical protein
MDYCYILDDEHHVVPAGPLTWARWLEDNRYRRVVEQTETKFYWVSTVFLGLDHGFGRNGPPVVFETMTFERDRRVKAVFGRLMPVLEEADDIDFGFNRYTSWDDALTGHRAIVGRIQRAEEKAEAMTPHAASAHRS